MAGLTPIDPTEFDVTDHQPLQTFVVLAGAIEDEEMIHPQVYMILEYLDDNDQKQSITISSDPWSMVRLGTALSQSSIMSTENFIEARRQYLDQMTKDAEAAQAERSHEPPSPYM